MRLFCFLALVAMLATLGACSGGGQASSSSSGMGGGSAASSTSGTSTSGTSTSGNGTGGNGTGGSGTGGSGTGGGSERIVAAATNGMLDVPFTVSATGAGTGVIGAISLTNGVGTVQIGGQTVQAAAYEKQPFGAYTLYQTLAVSPDRIDVLWLYCDSGVLDTVYYEDTDGTPVTDVAATGTCTESTTPSVEHVTFPAIDMPIPPLLTGYTVSGADVAIPSGMPGAVTLGSTTLTVLAFNSVNCSTTCGSPGWYEIHALLWDPEASQVSFAIFYLFAPGMPVEVAYSLTLPDLSDLGGTTDLTATFTHP